MTQRTLYIVIGVLVVAVLVLAYGWYNEANTKRVDINIGNGGLTIQSN